MADNSPLNSPYLKQYNDYLSQRMAQLSQPRGSDLDPMTMLAVAQGLLSPTRTGSFGESVGNAAGAAIGPLSRARTADAERLEKIDKLRETQIKLALEQQRLNDLNSRAAAGYGSAGRDPSLVFETNFNALDKALKAIDVQGMDIEDPTSEAGQAEIARRRALAADYRRRMDDLIRRQTGVSSSASDDKAEPSSTAPARGGPSGAAPAQAGRAGRVASDSDLQAAQDAYKRGAPLDAIIKRFKDNGITGITPEDITGK